MNHFHEVFPSLKHFLPIFNLTKELNHANSASTGSVTAYSAP